MPRPSRPLRFYVLCFSASIIICALVWFQDRCHYNKILNSHINSIVSQRSTKHIIIPPAGDPVAVVQNDDAHASQQTAKKMAPAASETPEEAPDATQAQNEAPAHSLTPDILFTPDDRVRERLIECIQQENKRIEVAVFTFTDMLIAQALIAAHEKGVIVELVTDPVTLKDRNSKAALLVRNSIPVYVYNPEHGKKGLPSNMHDKFIVFHRQQDGCPRVWTGSCNFTRSGCESNQENALILKGRECVTIYHKQFKKLKQRSYRFTLENNNHDKK